MKDRIVKNSLLLLMTVSLFSCAPTGKHPRKKLPDALDNDPVTPAWVSITEGSLRKKLTEPANDWLSLCPPASNLHNNNQGSDDQATCNIAETTVGGKSWYSVQIASGANDEAILDMVRSYRPFASSVVGMFLRNGREGALIDLSSTDANNTERTGFVVKNEKGQSFSLAFIWDRPATARAAVFMNELQQVPGLTVTRIDNNY